MIVLGLHFGHDASITVIKDGKVLSYLYQERQNKIKHAIGLTDSLLNISLREANVEVSDVDYCAITSTQGVELITTDLSLEIDFSAVHKTDADYSLQEQYSGSEFQASLSNNLFETLYEGAQDSHWHETWSKMYPQYKERSREEQSFVGWADDYIKVPEWEQGASFQGLRDSKIELSEVYRNGFHYPVTAFLCGVKIPAYFIHHHMAHAGSSFYTSGFNNAGIITHDGHADGASYHSGMCYYGQDKHLYPLFPHHLNLGALYDRVGMNLGLGTTGPAGKLMGLSAYGKPRFFDSKFVGNFYDQKDLTSTDINSAWLLHCVKRARAMGYDMTHYRDPAHANAPINADMAASTQKLFEMTRMEVVHILFDKLQSNKLDTQNLCLSGGTALNCPSNSEIYNEGPFTDVYIEPACDDGGLSIGAALVLYHNILEQPRLEEKPYDSVYLGPVIETDAIETQIKAQADTLNYQRCDDVALSAAEDLKDNRVVAWFQGSSELGPRALGHRSILANPTYEDNWRRVNELKTRELWRPFAPVVLEEAVEQWFYDAPQHSPHMLFNARVKTTELPAITHVDGTARIQTVKESEGEYYRVLKHFHALTGVGVLMNTSFNGPGQPIIETASEAITFFLNSPFDALYIGPFKITRREA
jgi:carbamoyltransferase